MDVFWFLFISFYTRSSGNCCFRWEYKRHDRIITQPPNPLARFQIIKRLSRIIVLRRTTIDYGDSLKTATIVSPWRNNWAHNDYNNDINITIYILCRDRSKYAIKTITNYSLTTSARFEFKN